MKLETFFEKFDQFAEAPDAVAKMRELVLNLAVQGKLVEQDPGDESASDMLERLGRELTPEQRRRQAAPLSPLPAEASLYELPDGWAWARFRDVAIIASNLVKPDDFLDFTHLAPDNIGKGNGVLLPCRTVREDKVISSNHRFYPGQIVYSKIRPNLAKVVVVNFEGLCSADMYPIDALIDAIYLQCYMLSGSFLVQAVKTDTRVAMPKINQTELNAIAVPVPPLAEQKRIVAKVDELMALCDRLEAQQQERETRHAALARASLARFADAPTPANLPFLFHPSCAIPPADLRNSILTLAVQGKLAPQDPNDEPGEVILRRIHSDYSSKEAANGSDPSEDLVELPFELPNGWSASRLGSILDPKRGISYGVIKLGAEPQQGGVFILRCSNVRFRRIDLNGIRKVTEQLSSEYGRTILQGGEVLINVRGTLGGCAVVPPALKGYNIAREVAVIPVHSEIDATFLLNVIASPYFQDRVDENLRGIAYEGLNLGLLRDFIIPVPPLAEQRRIVAKVEQLMALVDALETQLAASRATAANLLSALVAELTTRS